jgi:photosystem II stability/assembly factor-like uncharacterized protein
LGLVLTVCTALLVPPAAAQRAAVESRLAATSLLLDGTAAGSRLVVVGERGHILFSDDRGATWTQAQVPVQVMLTAVRMHDAQTGWAVGHDAVILRTRDGGETWQLVHYAPQAQLPLLDVWFRDADNGLAVGAFGTFLASADGGDTWTCRNGCWEESDGERDAPLLHAADNDFEDDFHLNAIAPADTSRLYLAGEAGVLYRSDDGGETWHALPSPYSGSWFGALALDATTVLVAGLRGRLFRSEDAGESWTQIETGTTATLTDFVQVNPNLILITGLAGALLTSHDSGLSVSYRPLPSRQGVSTALTTDGGSVVLVGESGVELLSGIE